jgi:hypothetical protein
MLRLSFNESVRTFATDLGRFHFTILRHAGKGNLKLYFMFRQIPFVIFTLIHDYLSHYDYRQFLNSSRSLFASVKYETVYYDFQWLDVNFSFSWLHGIGYKIHSKIKNVKNPEKQIHMKCLCKVGNYLVESLINMIGIHTLTLNFPVYLKKIVPLNMLSSIYSLQLSGIWNTSLNGLADMINSTEATSVPSPLVMRLHSLKLTQCTELKDITELSSVLTLKKVEINLCNQLSDLSSLRYLEEIKIINCENIHDLTAILDSEKNPCLKTLTICCKKFGTEIFIFHNFKQLLQVTSLTIESLFSKSLVFLDFSEENEETQVENYNIKHLRFINSTESFAEDFGYLILPQFRSLSTLSLTGSNIASWNKPFPSLYSVSLLDCLLPTNLLCFQGVTKMTLETIDIEILNISGVFQNLRLLILKDIIKLKIVIIGSSIIQNLNIIECSGLRSILQIGKIHSLVVQRCAWLSEIEGLRNANSIELHGLHSFMDFSFLINVSCKVVIHNCCYFVKEKYVSIIENIPDFVVTW